MNISGLPRNNTKVSMTDLRRNPRKIMRIADDLPVAILYRNKPTAYLLPARLYEALLELIDDASLLKKIQTLKGGESTKVKL